MKKASSGSQPRNRAKKSVRRFRMPEFFAPHAKWITIGIIIICFITVLGAMFALWYFTPEKIANREIEYLAKDYYENYFYDDYFGSLPEENRGVEFKRYVTLGLAPTYLRQLLQFDNSRHTSSAVKFSNPVYFCDTNKTKVIFYPHAPFGKTDYTMKIDLSCEPQ